MDARRRCLFLDRDGVVNEERHYVHRREDFVFLPGIFDLVRFAVRDLGWLAIVVTNQSGIARGYYDEAAFDALNAWMLTRFEAEGAPLTRVYHCPYHPTEGIGKWRQDHPWRKPKPGMLLQAADDFAIDLPRSAMIGDSEADMAAAAAAGLALRIRILRENGSVGATPPVTPQAEASAILPVRDLEGARRALADAVAAERGGDR